MYDAVQCCYEDVYALDTPYRVRIQLDHGRPGCHFTKRCCICKKRPAISISGAVCTECRNEYIATHLRQKDEQRVDQGTQEAQEQEEIGRVPNCS